MLKPSATIKKLAKQQLARIKKERERAQATGELKWELQAKEKLDTLRKERKVSYKELSRLLTSEGIEESAAQLGRKINRMKFSAAFYLACIHVLENVADSHAQENAKNRQ